MLSAENNDLICRVGRGTPMGELMRQYWIPALPSAEFPTPDCPPKRMILLAENIVMFRDSEGRMGALEEGCPHRGASLYFGRNEEGGLRCPYHGWKFDITGKCLETPTEQPERRERFCASIKARAFPCHEVNHMVWVYLGPREIPPPFPTFEVNVVPQEQSLEPRGMMEEANWLQNLEGDLDSVHLEWVHSRMSEDSPQPEQGLRGFWNPTGVPPQIEVMPTNYGAYYTAKRMMKDGSEWHRINQFIFPFHTMINSSDGTVNLRSFVPIDDTHALLWTQTAHPTKALTQKEAEDCYFIMGDKYQSVGGYIDRTNDPRTYYMTKANRHNDYGSDMTRKNDVMFSNIPFVGNLQDRAMTEFMLNSQGEPIIDRTKEHLSASDVMIVAIRQQLIKAATKLRDDGEAPANVDDIDLDEVRSASFLSPAGADWKGMSVEFRKLQRGEPAVTMPVIF